MVCFSFWFGEVRSLVVSDNIIANRIALALSKVNSCKLLITMDEYSGFMPEGLKVESYEKLLEQNMQKKLVLLIIFMKHMKN